MEIPANLFWVYPADSDPYNFTASRFDPKTTNYGEKQDNWMTGRTYNGAAQAGTIQQSLQDGFDRAQTGVRVSTCDKIKNKITGLVGNTYNVELTTENGYIPETQWLHLITGGENGYSLQAYTGNNTMFALTLGDKIIDRYGLCGKCHKKTHEAAIECGLIGSNPQGLPTSDEGGDRAYGSASSSWSLANGSGGLYNPTSCSTNAPKYGRGSGGRGGKGGKGGKGRPFRELNEIYVCQGHGEKKRRVHGSKEDREAEQQRLRQHQSREMDRRAAAARGRG